jgi:hypothetical protein
VRKRVLGNRLIHSMAPSERKTLDGELQSMTIGAHDVLSASRLSLSNVFFPTGAVISMTGISNKSIIEVRGVGSEGMLGADALRAIEHRFELACQIGGSMLYMHVSTFRHFIEKHVLLRNLVSRYSMSVLALMTQSILCNGLHSIAERCARWLLTTSDRAGILEFTLTHQSLAQMLGVRRSGVSVAVYRLQQLKIINYRHGRIAIVDRARLEGESCECYRLVVRETKRIFR